MDFEIIDYEPSEKMKEVNKKIKELRELIDSLPHTQIYKFVIGTRFIYEDNDLKLEYEVDKNGK